MAENDNQNLNITPEMISNLANMLKANISSSNTQNKQENYSNSSINETIQNLHNSSLGNNLKDENQSSRNNSDDFINNLDFETILKMKSLIENLNKKDDPRSNLLYSLKPYLRKSRQKKLDQYANLLKLSNLSRII